MSRALFLDRDGVLNERRFPFVGSPGRWRWRPGARAALGRAHAAGYALVLVTNQWPVGARLLPRAKLDALHEAMAKDAAEDGAAFARLQVCPHAPWQTCACRKPQPTMLREAAAALGVDLARSWMVGDQLKDVRAGHAAGCRVALVNPHWRPATWLKGRLEADVVAPGLPEALERILALDAQAGPR